MSEVGTDEIGGKGSPDVSTPTSDVASPTDVVLESSRRVNLAEKNELQALGYRVDDQGNVDTPPRWNLISNLKSKLFGNTPRDAHVPNPSRREFLQNSAKAGIAVAAGVVPGFPSTGVSSQQEGQSGVEGEVEKRKVLFNEGYIESGSVKTLVLADKLCFYSKAPLTEEEWGTLPQSNDDFYENQQGEVHGFVEKPSFLVLHTDGSSDIRSTIQSLENRNIQCQFFVGTIGGEATSIQSAYLEEDRINVTGTTGGGRDNPYEANLQFWGSLNIEIEGSPGVVEPQLVDKTVALCLDIMPVYGLKISQVIGHLEVPNNGKTDPGSEVLKEMRTRVYIELLQKGLYHLIDVYPDAQEELSNYFLVDSNPVDSAVLNNEGRVKCNLSSENSFVDWSRVEEFLNANPANLADLRRHREGMMQVSAIGSKQSRELNELYMGFPPSFTEWLRMPTKPLGSQEFSEYQPGSTANYIYRIRNIVSNGEQLLGSSLPFSYEVAQNLARTFVEEKPYENRGQELTEAMVTVAENVGDTQAAWKVIETYYTKRYGDPPVLNPSN